MAVLIQVVCDQQEQLKRDFKHFLDYLEPFSNLNITHQL